jgi:hypothetical protein
MKRLRKMLAIIALVSAVGFSYALFVLKGIPESFDWETDDE